MKKKELEALFKISKAITSQSILEDILKLIVTVTAEITGSKICSLMLLDEDGFLRIKATQSVSKEYIEKPPLRLGEGIAGKALKERTAITVYDVTKRKEYKYKNIAKKEGLVSLLCIPLIVREKPLGVLNVYTSKPHKFTKKEIQVISTIATQAALVIENTRLLIQTKLIQEELETRKLVERAKGILMKELNLDEEQAYRLMQKYSMDKREPLKKVAEAVITNYELRKRKF